MLDNISFRIDGLEQAIKDAIAQAIEAKTPVKEVEESKQQSEYYTRDELCHLAHISASTLWRMEKDNLYSKKVIDELLATGKLNKYAR